jgi:hypothetical protein
MLRTALLLAAFTVVAQAHDAQHESDWIQDGAFRDPTSNAHCCGENDCLKVPDGGIAEVTGGYFIRESSETIPASRVLWRSPDGGWWRCAPVEWSGTEAKRPKTRCLIGPPPST